MLAMLVSTLLVLALPATASPTPRGLARRTPGRQPLSLPITHQAGHVLGKRSAEKEPVAAPLLNPFNDMQYKVELALGSPPQPMNLILDTGSPTLWALGPECNTTACAPTPRFDTAKSTSFKPSDEGVTLRYGSGSITGVWAEDVATIGPLSVPVELVVANHTNLVAAGSNSDIQLQGILGLSRPVRRKTSSGRAWPEPAWKHMLKDGEFENHEFGIYLERDAFRNHGNAARIPGGEFTLGGYNEALVEGEFNRLDLAKVNTTYWTVGMEGFSVGGKNVSVGAQKVTVLDTGSSASFGPDEFVRELYGNLAGARRLLINRQVWYTFPCESIYGLDVRFAFNGVEYAVHPSDLANDARPFNIPNSESCVGYFIAATFGSLVGDPDLHWLLGANFLKNVYTTYSDDPPSVGMAHLAEAANKRDPKWTSAPQNGTESGNATTTATPSATGVPNTTTAAEETPSATGVPSTTSVGPTK